ncbi:MAG: PIG-L family deacetylase, partial [Anaerolineae bacterium]|nr:PIG-L family deacetylase [Anaerolineae bacterium]
DEIFIGGTLVHLAQNHVDVHLLCVTHGESGAPGFPPIANRDELGAIRTQEMHCAAQVIGAVTLNFLDYKDEVSPNHELMEFVHDPVQFEAELVTAIERVQPDVIITHGSDGEYGHPAHRLVHRSVLAAAQALTDNMPLVYSFQAIFDQHPDPDTANQSDVAHIIVPTAVYIASHMMRLFECHWTQSSWWLHLKSEKLGRPATKAESWHLHPLESLHRHLPPVATGTPDDHFSQWCQDHLPPEPNS